ncbi:MAG TPA: hypothetical protein VMD29_13830 [Terracidiphilus sp.]|nr:hypothetical protein [Terracidiphilus sp.]
MTTRQWTPRSAKILCATAFLLVIVFAGWWALYPGPDDPKGMIYIAWRTGLPTGDPDRELGTMVGDIHRQNLVIGKTKSELIRKFGYVTSFDEASEYYRFCYNTSDYKGTQMLFLRRSNWMVVMRNGRATDLVLLKGC